MEPDRQSVPCIEDDELKAITNLSRLIVDHAPHLNILGQFTDADEAARLIDELRPDILFIDVEMPGLNGFQLLEKITYQSMFIVFCTGHSGYALQALKANAFDYLMKPLDTAELKKTIERIMDRSYVRLTDMIDSVRRIFQVRDPRRIPLPASGHIGFVIEEELSVIEGDHKNATVHLTSGKSQQVGMSLGDYEHMLCAPNQPLQRIAAKDAAPAERDRLEGIES